MSDGAIEEIILGAEERRGKGPRWEVLLALLLGLGVLGFAGVDWWRGETLTRTYLAAQSAAEARDWDKARDGFARLGDFRDAPALARHAADQIAARDTAYTAGQEAAAQKSWLTAAAAFSTTIAIEPQYRDAQARFSAAGSALTQQALAGTIYRRGDSAGAGLYARPVSGPEVALPGSDGRSRVLAADGAAGYVVYDVPASLTSGLSAPATSELGPGRELRLAAVQDGTVRTFAVAAHVSSNLIALGRAGLWTRGGPVAIDGELSGGYRDGELSYLNPASGAQQPVKLPAANWRVLAVDAAGSHLLLGEILGLDTGDVPNTRLYRSGPDGGDPQPLYLSGGLIERADFSADGKLVLFSAHEERRLGLGTYRASLNLIDLRGDRPRTTTVTWATVASWITQAPLQGTLLPGVKARVLVRTQESVAPAFELRDIDSGRALRLWEGQTARPEQYWPVLDGNGLVFRTQRGDGQHFTLVYLDPVRPPPPLDLPLLPLAGNLLLADLQFSGGYVVYAVSSGGVDGGGPVRIYATPLTRAGSAAPPARLVLEAAGAATAMVLPGELLAYTHGADGLRLRNLSGSFEINAIPGADQLWRFGSNEAPAWMPQ